MVRAFRLAFARTAGALTAVVSVIGGLYAGAFYLDQKSRPQ